MAKGQFGARDLQKHLWKLSIPEYDATNRCIKTLIGRRPSGGERRGAASCKNYTKERGDTVSTTVVRRELRGWLAQSNEGKKVETLVKRLLA